MKRTLLALLAIVLTNAAFSQENEHKTAAENYQISTDMLFGHKDFVGEFFFLKPIDDKGRWLAVSRSELHLPNYRSDEQEFVNFNTFSYNFKNGLGIGAGSYASTHYRFSARIGLQYFKEKENYMVYSFLSTSVLNHADAQLLLIGSYTPAIATHWRFFSRAEWRSALEYGEGHTFSNQLVRLGVQYKKLAFGAGTELEETGKDFEEFHCNIGPFFRYLF